MPHLGYLVLQSILHMEDWQVSPRSRIHRSFTRRQRCFSLRDISNIAAPTLHRSWPGRNTKTEVKKGVPTYLCSCNNDICVFVMLRVIQREQTVTGLVPSDWPQSQTASMISGTEPSKTESTFRKFKRTYSVKKEIWCFRFIYFSSPEE